MYSSCVSLERAATLQFIAYSAMNFGITIREASRGSLGTLPETLRF